MKFIAFLTVLLLALSTYLCAQKRHHASVAENTVLRTDALEYKVDSLSKLVDSLNVYQTGMMTVMQDYETDLHNLVEIVTQHQDLILQHQKLIVQHQDLLRQHQELILTYAGKVDLHEKRLQDVEDLYDSANKRLVVVEKRPYLFSVQ